MNAPAGDLPAPSAPGTHLERSLRISEEHLRLLIESVIEYAMFFLDADGRIATWNPGAERIKGYTAREIIGRPYAQFFTPEDAAAGKPARLLAQARREGRVHDEGWRMRKDGTRFWAVAVLTALVEPDGTLRGFAKVTRDDTDRHQAAEALRQSEERFRLLVGGLKEHALYMLDPDGLVMSWNDGATRIKRYASEEVIGKHFSLFFTPEDRAAGKPELELAVARQRGSFEEEAWRVRKDGSRFWAAVVITPLLDATGTLRGFAKVTRDETARHEAVLAVQRAAERATAAEDEVRRYAVGLEARVAERTALLERQARELRAINAELEQFNHVASHDLQEPLRMVSVNLDLLEHRLRDRLDESSRACIRSAIDGTTRMRSLIRSLMDFAHVDHDPAPDAPTAADESLADALANLQPIISQSQAEVVAAPLPVVRAERGRLAQVFQNLIANGIKFNRSPRPLVELSAWREGQRWVIAVADNGIGIPEADRDKIFVTFHRLHQRTEFDGNGVGLAIVKKIVERCGGEVRVESEVGAGTRFLVVLPAVDPA